MNLAKHPSTLQNKYFGAVLALFALAGILFVLLSTHYGAFLSDDSYYYIEPPRAALQGNGFNPSPIFAPLLPFILFLLGKLGPDPLILIRFLNAFMFGFNILLTGIIAKQAGLSDYFAGMTALLVLLSDVLLQMFGWAMSEALYETIILFSVILFVWYLQRPSYTRLVLLAIAAGLACMTRYAGLPAVLALIIGLLVYDRGRPFMHRVWRSSVFAIVSLIPVGAYLARNILVSGRPTRYEGIQAIPLTLSRLTWYIYNTLDWFVPGRFIKGHELVAGILFTTLLAVACYMLFRIRRSSGIQGEVISAGIFVWIAFIILNYFMLFLAGGLSGLTADNARYLAPLLWAGLFIFSYFLYQLWKTGNQLVMVLVFTFSALFVVYYGSRAYNYLTSTYQSGLGYAAAGWYNSETVAYLKSHPDLEVVSTGDMGIYFWTGKRPASITDFGGAAGLKDHLCQTGGFLVILNSMPVDIYHMNLAEVTQGLTMVKKFNDSVMYQCPKT